VDNISCWFFAGTYPQEISATETGIIQNPDFETHFPFSGAAVFLTETVLIHRQNASMAISGNSLFLYFYAIFFNRKRGF